MLDPEAVDDARERVANDVRQQIEGAGTLDRADNWGMRKLAYEIRQGNEGVSRSYRFQSEPPLLERLDHSLKIADGVLRFRIFKVDPDTPTNPPPPTHRPALSARHRGPGDGRPRPGRPRAAPAPRRARGVAPASNGLLLSEHPRINAVSGLSPPRGRERPGGALTLSVGD